MAAIQVHECSTHRVTLCPENKSIVMTKYAEMVKTRASLKIADAINEIIEEWEIMKKGKAA